MSYQLNPVKIKHFANAGDIIASLAGVKRFSEKTNRRVIFCQQLNVPAEYYPGAVHPIRDDNGTMVMCNKQVFDLMRPLLLSQPYIEDMVVYNGQPINFDLDVIRKKIFVNLPHQALQQWVIMAYPDMACDLSKPWIEIDDIDISGCSLSDPQIISQTVPIDNLEERVLVNFTERYRNPHLDYFWLKEYQDRLMFSGTKDEYLSFVEKWKLPFVPYLNINNFLELSHIMKKVKFLLCNQSFQWNLSMAMKTPHVLELCEGAPNCQTFFYEKSLGHYHQNGLKLYFRNLLK